MTLSTIFKLYWWKKPEFPETTTGLSQVTDTLYYIMFNRVHRPWAEFLNLSGDSHWLHMSNRWCILLNFWYFGEIIKIRTLISKIFGWVQLKKNQSFVLKWTFHLLLFNNLLKWLALLGDMKWGRFD